MRVYRGPASKEFSPWDNGHEPVAIVKPEELEKSIKTGSYITFNINKESYERQSVCTTRFEEDDIIPMVKGLLTRLESKQSEIKSTKSKLEEIKKILTYHQYRKLSDSEKLLKIKEIL